MPQYRKLYCKIVESLDVNDMPDDFTRLLWVLLPLALCREGRGIDNPRWLQSRLFPLRADVTPEQIQAAFNWLCERGMVVRYTEGTPGAGGAGERAYFYLPTWGRYQGNTEREAPSNYPAPRRGEGDGDGDRSESQGDGAVGREAAAVASHARPAPDPLASHAGPALDRVASRSGPEADAAAEAGQQAETEAAAAAEAGSAVGLLVALGVEPAAAATLARQYPAAAIRGWIEYARTQTRLKDPPGFVISRLQRGLEPPTPPPRTNRYVSGPYADLIER